jgi:hypothetical protein
MLNDPKKPSGKLKSPVVIFFKYESISLIKINYRICKL